MPVVRREQIAGMNIHYTHYSLDYFFESMERAGFVTVAFWGGPPHFHLDYESYSNLKRIKNLARSHGQHIECFTAAGCAYGFQIGMQPIEYIENSFNYFRNGICAAAELGCRYMVINSGWGYLNESRDSAWARSREMLSRLAEEARKNEVILTLESLRSAESQIVYRLCDAKRIIEEVGHPSLKIMIDTTAVGVAGETVEEWFNCFGSNIVNTHFVDGTPYGHLAWGDGRFPLKRFLQCMNDYGYEGLLGLEITDRRYYADPCTADIQCMRTFSYYFD